MDRVEDKTALSLALLFNCCNFVILFIKYALFYIGLDLIVFLFKKIDLIRLTLNDKRFTVAHTISFRINSINLKFNEKSTSPFYHNFSEHYPIFFPK